MLLVTILVYGLSYSIVKLALNMLSIALFFPLIDPFERCLDMFYFFY